MENKKSIDEIIKTMTDEKTNGYGKWILPCSLDNDISNVLNEFIKLVPSQRDKFREKFTTIEHWDMLRVFSERMAIFAVRKKQPKWIFEGLIAQTIEDFRFDYRENMLIICLLDNATRKIGEEPVKIFDKAAEYANPRVAKTFRDYARMPVTKKGIEIMGYEEVIREDGFWYQRNW